MFLIIQFEVVKTKTCYVNISLATVQTKNAFSSFFNDTYAVVNSLLVSDKCI